MNEDELAAFLGQGLDGPPPEADADPASGGPAPRGAGRAGVGAGGDDLEATGAEGVRRLLGDDATWADPPAGGADALLAAIRAEPLRRGQPPAGAWGGPGSSGRTSRVPPRWQRPAQAAGHAPPARPAGWGTRQRAGLAVAAVAAVALLVVGVLGGMALRGDSDERIAGDGVEVALAGADLEPGASGWARLEETTSGVAVWLLTEDLPPAPPGAYYQAWLRGDAGAVTIGTFHLRDGEEPVVLWSGVDLERYPTLTVTLQQEGGGAESSGQVVLSGEVDTGA